MAKGHIVLLSMFASSVLTQLLPNAAVPALNILKIILMILYLIFKSNTVALYSAQMSQLIPLCLRFQTWQLPELNEPVMFHSIIMHRHSIAKS